MKKAAIAVMLLIAVSISLSAKTKTKRVDADKITDVDGYWNDNDVGIVCKDLIEKCVTSPRVAKFEEKNGRAPTVVLGVIKNESTEHIDTTIISKKMQTAILNNGVMEFVADKTERAELMEEAEYQGEHALDYSEDEEGEEVNKLDQSEAADFMLTGSVKAIVQQDGKTSVRAYTVTATITDVRTHRLVWQDECDVKKIIKRKKVKL